MLRSSVVLALATLLSTAVATAGIQSTPSAAGAQTPAPRPATQKPSTQKPATQKPATQKPVPKPAAPSPAVVAAKPEPAPRPATDVRVKTALTQAAQVSHNTTYLQGPRQRVEFPGLVTLEQCDLKRTVMLNTTTKRYRVQPYPDGSGPAASAPAVDPQAAQMAQAMAGGNPQNQPRGGVITFTTSLTDTLERQSMLGFEARRVKTVMAKQATSNACDKTPFKVEVDAWYIDLPAQSACARAAVAPPAPAPDPNACTDRVETRVVGDVKLGFPIKTVTTTTSGEGDKLEVSTVAQEVVELEVTRLDRALFEVPADFVEATSSAELVPQLASGGSLADALFGSTVDGSGAAAPKAKGSIRIGILEPINKTDRDLPPSSLRRDLVAKFNKAPYEAIPVAGTSPAAIAQEAARLECDYLMLAEIVEAKSSKPGKLGGVMKFAGGGPPKDSHEVKLDYKLFAVGATDSPKAKGNAKASSGGFGLGSALKIASFAGQMYMGVMMGGGMGMGMMNPMMMGMGGGMGPMAMGGYFDPRAAAITSIATSVGGSMMAGGMAGMSGMPGMPGMPGMEDQSAAEFRETVSNALGNSAKSAMQQLKR